MRLKLAFVLIWGGVTAVTYANVREQVEGRSDEQLAQAAQVLWLLYTAPRASRAGAGCGFAWSSSAVKHCLRNHAYTADDILTGAAL